jgi:putative DNA primase/helicase
MRSVLQNLGDIGANSSQAVGASLAAPDFGSNRPEDVSDFNDLHQCAGLDAVRACIEKAAPVNGACAAAESEPYEIDREIARLAKLRAVDYERERKDAAAKLNVRMSILDKLVSAARPPDDSAPGQGRSLKLDAPEPWPEPVHGAALLSALAGAIRQYVVLSKEDADHTYAFDAFSCTPRLAITSPTRRRYST